MKVSVNELTVSYLTSRLTEGKPFAFLRYGNGEWGCILRTAVRTGSGSHTLKPPALRDGLVRGIRRHQGVSNSYYLGMQSLSYLTRVSLLSRIEDWLSKRAPKSVWYGADVLHKASMKTKLNPMIQQLRKMRVVVVGPKWLRKLNEGVFGYVGFVEVPSRDCFYQYKRLKTELISKLDKQTVVVFCAGPPAKMMISEIYEQLGNKHFLIDYGSMWDPYCGKHSRRYHKRITQAVRRGNLKS